MANIFDRLRQSVLVKLFFVGFLILLLLIPLIMIQSLVYERESRHRDVINEVSQTWGYAQTLIGPIIGIPYRTYFKDDKGKVHTNLHRAYFLPDTLNIKGDIVPEMRSRGIYDVVVYRANLQLNGVFTQPDMAQWNIPDADILWSEASFFMGVSDTRGIRNTLNLQWDNQAVAFLSGTSNNGLFKKGLHVPLPHLKQATANTHQFNFELNLNGNDHLLFTPVGKQTLVTLQSTWAHPSFYGAFLPLERSISDSGFNAKWQVSHLGRSYPQAWNTERSNIEFNETYYYNSETSNFGLKLLIPVDFYTKTERSVKYGILFILLTFTIFFLFEIFNPIRIHSVQYLMVGFALSLFYLLLLSLSEHLGFTIAYLSASLATIGLIGFYAHSALKSAKRAAMLSIALLGLYLYLYVLLHLEDYALLFGALGLFVMLATVMMITRRIDWYAVKLNKAAD